MKDVVKIMAESKDLNKFFLTPYIDAKKRGSKRNFQRFISIFQNLIRLVIKHGRENQLKILLRNSSTKLKISTEYKESNFTTATQLSKENIDQI
jgi:F-type H+-transporting ATPase subunit delta